MLHTLHTLHILHPAHARNVRGAWSPRRPLTRRWSLGTTRGPANMADFPRFRKMVEKMVKSWTKTWKKSRKHIETYTSQAMLQWNWTVLLLLAWSNSIWRWKQANMGKKGICSESILALLWPPWRANRSKLQKWSENEWVVLWQSQNHGQYLTLPFESI